MRVLIAFDKFKDAITAREACAITAETLSALHPDWELDVCPLADGGDGFCQILTHAASGHERMARVTGPLGEPVDASYGLVALESLPAKARALLHPWTGGKADGEIALVEMAAASGLARVPADRRDPWHTTSHGTGELIRLAREHLPRLVLLGVGGSATHDLGLGALQALGLRFATSRGGLSTHPVPARWTEIERIVGATVASPIPIVIAVDTNAPLLGAQGAARVFGPQKGLRPGDVSRLDHATARLALMLGTHFGVPDTLIDEPGSGAAGGLPFGFRAAAGASVVSGSLLVAAWLDLDRRIDAADIVITGEGRFDATTLSGKGPGLVIDRGRAAGKAVHVFAGTAGATAAPAVRIHAITPEGTTAGDAIRHTRDNLAHAIAKNFP